MHEPPIPVAPTQRSKERASHRRRGRRWPLLAASVAAVLAATAGAVRIANARQYGAGLAAERAGDCAAAISHYQAVIGVRRVVGGGDVARAGRGSAGCRVLVAATKLREEERFQEALDQLTGFGSKHPGTELEPAAHEAEAGVHTDWGHALAAQGDEPAAVGQYAMAVNQFPGTKASAQANQELGALLAAATSAAAEAKDCDPLAVLDSFIVNEVKVKQARKSMPAALFACGESELKADRYSLARGHYERLIDEFPSNERVDDARIALIRLRVEVATLNKEPEMPQPHRTGTLLADGGVIHIHNASPYGVEYLFSGPQAVSVRIDPCPSCQVTSVPLTYCPSAGPEVAVTLKAGSYDVVAIADRGEFVFPFTGRWTVEPGASYSECYYLTSP